MMTGFRECKSSVVGHYSLHFYNHIAISVQLFELCAGGKIEFIALICETAVDLGYWNHRGMEK